MRVELCTSRLNPPSINHKLLVTNENVIKYGLDTKLKTLNKTCGEYRFIRNTIVHHDRFSEEDLDLLTFVHFSNDLGIISGLGSMIPEVELNAVTTEYMEECKAKHQEYLTAIENKLNELLDAACFIFAEKKLKYEKI